MNDASLLDEILRLAQDLPQGAVERLFEALAGLSDDPDPTDLHRCAAEIEPASLRRRVIGFLEVWRRNGATPPARSLAWALRSAAGMDHRHRSSETLELVWTGPSAAGFGFRRTDQALLEVISRATRCLYVVSFVAYKVPHVAEALVRAAERGVAIHLILESEKESERRVTFSALEALGPQVVARSRVYCWPVERRQRSPSGVLPSLHAKCAVADGKVLFISSANLTEHAHDYNMELGVLIVGGELPSQVEAHLEGLIESGVLILETT